MKKNIFLFLFLLLGGFLLPLQATTAQKSSSVVASQSSSTQTLESFTKRLSDLKHLLKTDKEKLHLVIRPNAIVKKITKLLESGNQMAEGFEDEHILFIKRIEQQINHIISYEKTLTRSDISKIHLYISTATSLLKEKISENKRKYFLNRTQYKKYKKQLLDLENTLIKETFDVQLVTYKGAQDILEYNFLHNPLRGLGVCFGIVASLLAFSEMNNYLDKKIEQEIKEKMADESFLKDQGYFKEHPKGGPKDTLQAREKFVVTTKNTAKNLSSATRFETKKIDSVLQGHDGVLNCGAHAMFHAECFLKELEKEIKIKPTREEFVVFWKEYLNWAKDLPKTKIAYENEDIKGDYISSDIIRYYFRNIRKNEKRRVHISEYGQVKSAIPDLTLLEQSTKDIYCSDRLLNLLDDDSKGGEDIRAFVLEWADLMSGNSKEPIICIISNGGHWIVAKYELDENKKIKITYRDSAGASTSIAEKPAQIIMNLGKDKLQQYKNIIEHPTEKIILKENTIFSEYLQGVVSSSDEEKLKNPLIKDLILLIKEIKKTKKDVEKNFVFKTPLSTSTDIAFSTEEFHREPLTISLILKEETIVPFFRIAIDDGNGGPSAPTPGTPEHAKQNGLPLNRWIKEILLQPLFDFALKEAEKTP